MTPERFRAHFPQLDAGLAHFAGCSQGAVPDVSEQAVAGYLAALRRKGTAWEEAVGAVEDARAGFAALVGAPAHTVAVLPDVTACAYQVASTLDWARLPGLVTCDAEFPTVAQVWLAQRPRGAHLVVARSPQDTAGAYRALTSGGGVGLVSVPLVSFRDGTRLPVRRCADAARAAGARVFVDASQGVGALRVDVGALDCDYLAATATKHLLGLPGLAFLYVRDGLTDPVAPTLTGWFGRPDPFAMRAEVDYPAQARRLQTGTPAIPSAYAAAASLGLLARVDRDALDAYTAALTEELDAALRAAGERVLSPRDPAARGPMVALRDDAPHRLAGWLAVRGVAASPRLDALRLSVHYYTAREDVARVVALVSAYRAEHPGVTGAPAGR